MLCKDMMPLLIERLQNESGIALSQNRAQSLWERFQDGFAHFVVIQGQIIGCCFIWHDSLKPDSESKYVELGTLWVQKQYRTSALLEISNNIRRIAKGKKILGFCKDLKVARFFVMSSLFPFSSIANWKNCPTEVIESCQFEKWHPTDISTQTRYTRVLYLEKNHELTSWYLIYE